jgi:hypothetical protein
MLAFTYVSSLATFFLGFGSVRELVGSFFGKLYTLELPLALLLYSIIKGRKNKKISSTVAPEPAQPAVKLETTEIHLRVNPTK